MNEAEALQTDFDVEFSNQTLIPGHACVGAVGDAAAKHAAGQANVTQVLGGVAGRGTMVSGTDGTPGQGWPCKGSS